MVRFTEGPQYGVRAICGKGGFPDEAIEPTQRLGMVYSRSSAGQQPSRRRRSRRSRRSPGRSSCPSACGNPGEDFGPLTVGIDAHGGSLYRDVQEQAMKKLEDIYARL